MSTPMDDSSEESHVDSSIHKDLDEAVIQDMPWAQELYQHLEKDLKMRFFNWCAVVKDVGGVDGDHVKQWGERYRQSINDLTRDMLNDMLLVQDKTTDTIQALLKQLQALCIALNQPMPNIGANGLCLYEEQKQLQTYIEKFESAVNTKKQELKKLEKKQLHYCKALGEDPKFKLEYPPMPTPEDLQNFEHHLQELETILFERHEKYCHLKAMIMEYVEQMHYKPVGDFERKVLSEDSIEFNKNNMTQLELFAEDLKKMKYSVEEEIVLLRGKIEDHWKMLDTDLKYRDDFRTRHTGNSLDILDTLRKEFQRCTELKKDNIQNFVEKLRRQLEALWEKCHCSDVVKKSFKLFDNDCYTEDLLYSHELEIEKWEAYYKDNEHLIQLLEKHSELWKKVTGLEENASGANRYKNRGGNLLQEEKERNKLSKLIPTIELEIRALCEEYENKHAGTPFMTFDKTPAEYIQYLHDKRENDRKMKITAHKMQRELTPGPSALKTPSSLYGPSTSKITTPVITPSAKRKLLTTPQTSKRAKNDVPRNLKATMLAKSAPKIKITVATHPTQSQKRQSRSSMSKRKRRVSKRKSRDFAPLSDDESGQNSRRSTLYAQFKERFSNDKSHSTIIQENISPSKKAPGKVLISSSKKTPSKVMISSSKKTSSKVLLNVPSSRTPLTPRTPNNQSGRHAKSHLSACKSNLKLLF